MWSTIDTAGQHLRRGLAELKLALGEQQIVALLDYLQLLQRWNRAFNLTAVTDADDMVVRHLLDSLAIAPYLVGKRFVDVGTGPGLPGIPLALVFPDRHFTLLDSNGKKVRFLFQARLSLGLPNVRELQARAESFRPEQLYDGVISRALATLPDMVASCRHLLAEGGHFYAMKGRYPNQELSQLVKPYNVCTARPLRVPGLNEDRHLIEIGISP